VAYGNLNRKMRHMSRKTQRPEQTVSKLREAPVLLAYMEKAQAMEASMPEAEWRAYSDLRVSA
jgi:hypothetical protein